LTQISVLNVSATENGIEIRNSRDVVVEGNGIDCKQMGIGVYRHNEYSLHILDMQQNCIPSQ